MTTLPDLKQFSDVKHHLKSKLERELVSLETRVKKLKNSSSQNREIIISTYQKIIDSKQNFKKRWDL